MGHEDDNMALDVYSDGLAIEPLRDSINKLNYNEKAKLINIIKVLKKYKKDLILKKQIYSFSKIKKKIISIGAKNVDYIKLIDLKTLKKPKKNNFNLFYAFYIGNVRLIDNF